MVLDINVPYDSVTLRGIILHESKLNFRNLMKIKIQNFYKYSDSSKWIWINVWYKKSEKHWAFLVTEINLNSQLKRQRFGPVYLCEVM